MKAWAICDTDGGRMPPKVMCRYIYPSEDTAKLKARFDGFDHKDYPVMEVEITIKEAE